MDWFQLLFTGVGVALLVRISFQLGELRGELRGVLPRIEDLETWRQGFPPIQT